MTERHEPTFIGLNMAGCPTRHRYGSLYHMTILNFRVFVSFKDMSICVKATFTHFGDRWLVASQNVLYSGDKRDVISLSLWRLLNVDREGRRKEPNHRKQKTENQRIGPQIEEANQTYVIFKT